MGLELQAQGNTSIGDQYLFVAQDQETRLVVTYALESEPGKSRRRLLVKRFTRLTLAFSKKLENLAAAVALHVAYFNFCWRMRENEGGRMRLTPAMQAGVMGRLWSFEDLYDAVVA